MREVRLHGELGARFGALHHFDCATPAEAVRALCANFKDFERHMVESRRDGVGYRVVVGEATVREERELHLPAGREVVRFIPVVMGAAEATNGSSGNSSQSGGKTAFWGIVLIIASFWIPGAWTLGGVSVSSVAFSIGASMVLTGVAQMMAPNPQADEPEDKNKPSSTFDGPVNTSAQGHPVPVGYGELIVGSAVISAGIVVEENPIYYEPDPEVVPMPDEPWGSQLA